MESPLQWQRLVRYKTDEGEIRFGQPKVSAEDADVLRLAKEGNLVVEVLKGESFLTARKSGIEDRVKELLAPLTVRDVPLIRCIGLNYKSHILETGRTLPKTPTLFIKPGTAVTGPLDATSVPRIAQAQCDYEGELVIVIGKDAKNVSEADALDYVAAYTVGNDVSTRDWQREADKVGPIPQWSFSKSFDGYAPIGPCLVSRAVLGAADGLSLTTRVNGEPRQSGNTADLCFGVRQLVAFCSQGQTLQAGSLIMTGTPGGVGLFMQPPKFLEDGDVVEVQIEGIGGIENKVRFE